MILDNKNENQKVYEWLKEYTEAGKIDIVTGYFTIGALSYYSFSESRAFQTMACTDGVQALSA